MKIAAAPAIVYGIQYAGSGPSKGVKLGTVPPGSVGESAGLGVELGEMEGLVVGAGELGELVGEVVGCVELFRAKACING